MKSIESLIRIDKKLRFYQLIYKHYKFSWKSVRFGSLASGVILALFFILSNYKIGLIWLLVPSVLLFGFSTWFIIKKTGFIINKKYPYAIKENGKWDYSSVVSIRKEVLKEEIKNYKLNEKENLCFLIDCLVRENEIKKYNYEFFSNGLLIILSARYSCSATTTRTRG